MDPLKEHELQLWNKYKFEDDGEALSELLVSMEPLLQRSVSKYRAAPIPSAALEAESRRLAVNAFNTYDPNKSQLNTHTTNHLKHLQRYVLKYQNVGNIPETRGIQISRFENTKSHMEEDLRREPSMAELADALDWSVAEVERMEKELRKDLSVSEGKAETFFDYTTQGEEEAEIKEAVQFVWYDSNNIERKILEYSFGMGGRPKMNTKEIARQLNLTESQIRTSNKKLAQKINSVRYL